jgi:hypothetical protein
LFWPPSHLCDLRTHKCTHMSWVEVYVSAKWGRRPVDKHVAHFCLKHDWTWALIDWP